MKFRALTLASICALSLTLLSLTLLLPARAGTGQRATADEYVAAVRQNVVFLVASGRLAEQHSASDKIKAFARKEASDEELVADNLQFWQNERGLSAFGPAMVASTGIETVTDMADTIMTGRSVAVDSVAVADWSRPDSGVLMVSPGVLVMPQLSRLDGDAFDALYKKTQAIALRELVGFYEAYSLTGKDAALKASALRQLPLVKERLAELEAL